mgnify:CR=1 FL=1
MGASVTLYLDMDGVIADFFSLLAKENNVTHWKSIKDKERALVEARNTDFFNRIDEFPSTPKLIEFAKSIGDWGICSSPLRGDRDNSAYYKRRWLEDNDLMPPAIENVIFTGQKEHYSINSIDGSPNILVDDKPSNIEKWEKAGGIGFLYQANQDSYADLVKNINMVYSHGLYRT